MNKFETQILYIMGVSGVGKTTIGKLLSEVLKIPFFDGDDYHPPQNIAKMSKGIALNDADRKGWLQTLNDLAVDQLKTNGCIIVCSALKESYRSILNTDLESQSKWIFLNGSFDLITNRMAARKGHYMHADMLQSQFDILEEPQNAIKIDIINSPEVIVKEIQKILTNQNEILCQNQP